ncbi:MAG: leucine-rich repeat domain-containing protein [Firmicutes bacterium]|nr:leucine-rich repeat domain-containing protein [Bacillota bacterium]
MTTLGDSAFEGCTSLTELIIPESLTSLSTSAFNKCSSIETVSFPENFSSFGISCFAYCSSITEIVIPDTVTAIPISCFAYCTALESLTIPDTVTTISDSCIDGDTNIVIYTWSDSYADYWSKENGKTIVYLGEAENVYEEPDAGTVWLSSSELLELAEYYADIWADEILAYDVRFDGWAYSVEIETLTGKHTFGVSNEGEITSYTFDEYASALSSVWGTADEAEELALADAGYTRDDVWYVNSYIEYSDGTPYFYVVSFRLRDEDVSFEYKIHIVSGSITSRASEG